MVVPLERIDPGGAARIVWIASEAPMARQLNALGFEPGLEIRCVLHDQAGSMAAYLVNDMVIALRRNTAREILVKPLDDAMA